MRYDTLVTLGTVIIILALILWGHESTVADHMLQNKRIAACATIEDGLAKAICVEHSR